jgi:O-antigen ligase
MTLAEPLRAAPLTPFQKIGFLFLVVFLFLVHARIMDRFWYLHVPILTYWLAVAAAVLTGGVLRVFSSRVGVFLVGMVAWMMVATPFSYWKGGSFETMKGMAKSFLMYVLIVGLTYTCRQCRRLMHTLAYSVTALAIWTLLLGETKEGRIYLPYGRYANPNEMGLVMVIGLAFWWYIASDPNLHPLRRGLAVAGVAPMLAVLTRTGSRTALIALAVLIVQLFIKASLTGKIKVGLAAMLTVALAAAFLPGHLKERYFILFSPGDSQEYSEPSSEQEQRTEDVATGSAQARWALLMKSVRITVEHPLLGVGPGMFPVAQDVDASLQGGPGMWRGTHNTYTQLSSENGLPALFLYLASLLCCLRLIRSLGKRGREAGGVLGADVAHASFCLRVALLAYSVGAFVTHLAYDMYYPVLAGLTVAWGLAAPAGLSQAVAGAESDAGGRAPARPPGAAVNGYRPPWRRPAFARQSSLKNLPR